MYVEDLEKKISLKEAKKATEILLQYVEQQQYSTALDVLNIHIWKGSSFRKSLKVKTEKNNWLVQ